MCICRGKFSAVYSFTFSCDELRNSLIRFFFFETKNRVVHIYEFNGRFVVYSKLANSMGARLLEMSVGKGGTD